MSANILQFRGQTPEKEPDPLERLEAFGIAHGFTIEEAIVHAIPADFEHTYERLEAVKLYTERIGSFPVAAFELFEAMSDLEVENAVTWQNTIAAYAEELESEFQDFLSSGYVPKDLPANVLEFPPPPTYPDADVGTAS